jgi:hypothetical protein
VRLAPQGGMARAAAAAALCLLQLLALAGDAGVLAGAELSPAGARALLGHSDHSYKPQEKVALYANKAGPFHNPRHA